jgi:hypothetical protein
MNRVRIIGGLVALLGVGVIVYSLADFLGIGTQTAGIGAIPNSTMILGAVLLVAGLVAAITAEPLNR